MYNYSINVDYKLCETLPALFHTPTYDQINFGKYYHGEKLCEEYDEITPKGFVRPVKTYKVISSKNKSNSKTKKSYSKKGNHVDIQIFDSSDMKAAIKELKKLQEDFSKEIEEE